jgi:hypothetical protein
MAALVALDPETRPGELVGRACAHLLDQAPSIAEALVVHVAQQRHTTPSDRTVILAIRIDPAVVARATAWCDAHPGLALSWLIDSAIRAYHEMLKGLDHKTLHISGMAPRRYARVHRDLLVVVDDAHAA